MNDCTFNNLGVVANMGNGDLAVFNRMHATNCLTGIGLGGTTAQPIAPVVVMNSTNLSFGDRFGNANTGSNGVMAILNCDATITNAYGEMFFNGSYPGLTLTASNSAFRGWGASECFYSTQPNFTLISISNTTQFYLVFDASNTNVTVLSDYNSYGKNLTSNHTANWHLGASNWSTLAGWTNYTKQDIHSTAQ